MADEINVDIEKRFPAGAAIQANFRLDLAESSTVILFGPSGSGKTTVLRSIAGLESPDRGLIRFGDEVWLDTSRRICLRPELRKVGLLFQEPTLFPHMTVRQNIEYGLHHLSRRDRRRASDEMMRLFEIHDLADRRPREISGGQAQRVALARAVAPRPRVLLLDEPLAALDAPTRSRLRVELRRLLQRIRIPAVLVTHDRTEAVSLGDRIVVMAEGEVRQIGAVDEVFQHPTSAAVAGSVGVETILHGDIVEVEDGIAKVRVGNSKISAVAREELCEAQRVLVCIRAETVTLQRDSRPVESARNHFIGKIESIESDGAVERITIDCGFQLVALITRTAREELGLSCGDVVTVALKATAVHLIKVYEDRSSEPV